MKFLIHLAISLSLSLSTYACEIESWAEHYINGLKYSEQKNFELALEEFNSGIDDLLQESDFLENEFVCFYIERAACYMRLKQYQDIIDDMTMVLAEYKMNNRDLETAYLNRAIAYGNLENLDMMRRDLTIYQQMTGMINLMPSRDYTIMRNVNQARHIFKGVADGMLFCGLIESLDDVQLFGEETIVIKRKPYHACPCVEKGCGCGAPDPNNPFDNRNNPNNGGGQQQRAEDDCKSWCKYAVDIGVLWVEKRFARYSWCWGMGMSVLASMQDGCNYCCDGGNFYSNCIKPFENLCRNMDENQCTTDCRTWQPAR